MSDDVRRPRRKEEPSLPREPADQATEELTRLARILEENPDPVFRISAGHVLLYRNPAGEQLCRVWGCRLGQKVPAALRAIISAALAEGAVARHKIAFGSHIYGLTVAPSVADGYVNIYARDITDYKQAQEALRQAEQKFRTIFDNTSDGIFLLDLETRKFTMGNNSCLQMLGYTEEEFAKLGIADLHPEADLPFIYAQIEKFLQGGKPIRHDIRFRRKDGSILFTDLSPDLVLLDGKRYIVVALKDVTERKRAEEVLAASERKYRSLVQNIPDVTWTTDRDGRTLFISPNVRDVYGYSAEEVCAEGDTRLGNVHPDDRPRVEEAFHELFTQKKPYDVEYRIRRKDGTWIWLHDRSVSTYEKEGQWYADGVFSDVTQRKRMEEELRQHAEHLEELVEARTREVQESERRYRSLAENDPDIIQRLDRELRRLYVNPAFAQATGLSPPAVIGKTDRELGLPEDLIPFREQAAQTVLRTGERQIIEFETPTPRGPRHYEAHLVPEFAPDGAVEHLLAITRDITERKRAEEALRELNATLEAKVAQRTEDLRHTVDRLQQLTLELSQAEDRERKRIADILHEDVQQMLAAAKFHLNLLSSEPRSAEESREIVEQVKHMLKDAIEKSRSLSHELSPALYQVELVEILNWLARHMQQKHGLTVRVEAHGPVDSPSEPLKAFLYKVVQELLFNVVKHAGVRQARIRVRRMGPCLYLSVVDRGRGFDPEKLERAAGFGLLGIRERVQLLGGCMKIKSAPGAGCRSLIAIPYEAASRIAGPAEGRNGQVQPGVPPQNNRAETP